MTNTSSDAVNQIGREIEEDKAKFNTEKTALSAATAEKTRLAELIKKMETDVEKLKRDIEQNKTKLHDVEMKERKSTETVKVLEREISTKNSHLAEELRKIQLNLGGKLGGK